MAAIGVYLVSSPSGRPTKTDVRGLGKLLSERGYRVKELHPFNDRDIFVELSSGASCDMVRCFDMETLVAMNQAGYRDNTRYYELM